MSMIAGFSLCLNLFIVAQESIIRWVTQRGQYCRPAILIATHLVREQCRIPEYKPVEWSWLSWSSGCLHFFACILVFLELIMAWCHGAEKQDLTGRVGTCFARLKTWALALQRHQVALLTRTWALALQGHQAYQFSYERHETSSHPCLALTIIISVQFFFVAAMRYAEHNGLGMLQDWWSFERGLFVGTSGEEGWNVACITQGMEKPTTGATVTV